MSFKEAVIKCFNNFTNFNGRARRSEFWYFFLFDIAAVSVVNILTTSGESEGTSLLASIVSLALLCPLLSVGSRRMHDIGKNGKLTFLQLIPIAQIYFMYLCAKDSEMAANQYGPCPKGQNAEFVQPQVPVSFVNTEEKEEYHETRPNAINISDHVSGSREEVPSPKVDVSAEIPEIPQQEKSDEIQQYFKDKKNPKEKKFCSNCGTQLEEGDNFCNNCGTKVE